MKRKSLILSIIGISVFVLGAGFFVFKDKLPFLAKKSLMVNPASQTKNQKKEKIKFNLVEWEDLAGFAFLYPEELEINNFPDEKIYYAHLELTNPEKPGKITILCNDSEYVDIDTWAKEDKLASQGLSLDTEAASMSAKKIALSNGKELIGFIDWDQVIYTIEADSKNDVYWNEVVSEILNSFKLIPLEGETQEEFSNWLEGFDTSAADIIEPVEIIQ
jgi:hypothetical protein